MPFTPLEILTCNRPGLRLSQNTMKHPLLTHIGPTATSEKPPEYSPSKIITNA
jgi:hypothetical protein